MVGNGRRSWMAAKEKVLQHLQQGLLNVRKVLVPEEAGDRVQPIFPSPRAHGFEPVLGTSNASQGRTPDPISARNNNPTIVQLSNRRNRAGISVRPRAGGIYVKTRKR